MNQESSSISSANQPAPRLSRESWRRIFLDLARGRREALGELYEAASRQIFGLALWRTGRAEDAGDVVQEVFVRLAGQREKLAAVKDPQAWLFTVAHRAAIDVTRLRSRRPEEPLEQCLFLEAAAGDPDRAVDAAKASALLVELPPAQREVIYLHHFAGCTFADIGRILGIPTFTAASRYRLGLRKLRRMMEKKP